MKTRQITIRSQPNCFEFFFVVVNIVVVVLIVFVAIYIGVCFGEQKLIVALFVVTDYIIISCGK